MSDKGQYFTTNLKLKNYVYQFIKNDPKNILEPSVGQGDLVVFTQDKLKKVEFDMYEIDTNIKLLEGIRTEKIVYGDFLNQEIEKKYHTIIGNPPYVRTTKGNLYIDFIEKCFHLLEENGELIFIVPKDFFKLTSSGKILEEMLQIGTFTDIYHPNKENLFQGASIDVIVFRYCKDSNLPNITNLNGKEKYLINTSGVITFSDDKDQLNMKKFLDYFDIYVGLVTGKESFFKNNEFGNIELINGKDKLDKYILINKFPTDNKKLNDYFNQNKEELISRRIKKFKESNWFEWGALRNIEKMKRHKDKDCIYVSCVTRSTEVAFVDKVNFFGGGLICMIPKEEINLDKILNYLNSDQFKENYMYSGRFKIGHRQLCNHLFKYEYLI